MTTCLSAVELRLLLAATGHRWRCHARRETSFSSDKDTPWAWPQAENRQKESTNTHTHAAQKARKKTKALHPRKQGRSRCETLPNRWAGIPQSFAHPTHAAGTALGTLAYPACPANGADITARQSPSRGHQLHGQGYISSRSTFPCIQRRTARSN